MYVIAGAEESIGGKSGPLRCSLDKNGRLAGRSLQAGRMKRNMRTLL